MNETVTFERRGQVITLSVVRGPYGVSCMTSKQTCGAHKSLFGNTSACKYGGIPYIDRPDGNVIPNFDCPILAALAKEAGK